MNACFSRDVVLGDLVSEFIAYCSRTLNNTDSVQRQEGVHAYRKMRILYR